jgi:hypothetical protein
VKTEVVGEVRVDAVTGESTPQTIASVTLNGHRLDGVFAAHERAGLIADAHQATHRLTLSF